MFHDGRSPYPRQDPQFHITQIQGRLSSLRQSLAAWNAIHDRQISVRYQEDAQYEHAIGFIRAEQKHLESWLQFHLSVTTTVIPPPFLQPPIGTHPRQQASQRHDSGAPPSQFSSSAWEGAGKKEELAAISSSRRGCSCPVPECERTNFRTPNRVLCHLKIEHPGWRPSDVETPSTKHDTGKGPGTHIAWSDEQERSGSETTISTEPLSPLSLGPKELARRIGPTISSITD